MADPLNGVDVAAFLASKRKQQEASIFSGLTQKNLEIQLVTFTLTAGTALVRGLAKEVNFPFKSFCVIDVSHPSLKINLLANTIDEFQSAIPVGLGTSFSFGDYEISKAFVYWTAQNPMPGVALTVTVLFSKNAEIRSGSVALQGGVKTDMYGSALQARVAVVGAAAAVSISEPSTYAQVPTFTQGLDRQVLVYNDSANTVYLGPALVDDGSGGGGVNKGYPLLPGNEFKWNNKTILYAYAAVNSTIGIWIEY